MKAFANSANVAWKHQPKFQGKFPKGGRRAAPSSPSYRLALVKPGWSVARDVVTQA
jgi:hypothetical protein